MLWLVGAGILVVWFVLTFLLHKGGLIHILLLCGLSTLVVEFVAYRKTRYQRNQSSRRDKSE